MTEQKVKKSKADEALIMRALHRSSFFTCLDEEQVQRFVDEAVLTTFKPGEVLINKGTQKDPVYGEMSAGGADSPIAIYVVRSGTCDVGMNSDDPASVPMFTIGEGDIVGEGAVVFQRARSASVVASGSVDKIVECWTVSGDILRNHVLKSNHVVSIFNKYASLTSEDGTPLMTMDDFVDSCLGDSTGENDKSKDILKWRLGNTLGILFIQNEQNNERINLEDFCVFHMLMSRPDPEVDIAFIFMDRHRRGYIDLDDFKDYLKIQTGGNNLWKRFIGIKRTSDFIRRFFGEDGTRVIRHYSFSQFLHEFQREYGRQAYLEAIEKFGDNGVIAPECLIELLKSSCGWHLPNKVLERLQSIYCGDPFVAAESTAKSALTAERIKGSTMEDAIVNTSASILANIKERSENRGEHYFDFNDFCAFQEVIGQLSGICNLIYTACESKNGPISPDDMKVANRVTGIGGKLSRRQVEIIFQLFDYDRDGYISYADAVGIVGANYIKRLVPL